MPPYGPGSPDNAKDQAFKPLSMVSATPVTNAAEVPATKATGRLYNPAQRDVMTRAIELARAEGGANTQA